MEPNPYQSPQTCPAKENSPYRFHFTLLDLLAILTLGAVIASLFVPPLKSSPRPRYQEPARELDRSLDDLPNAPGGNGNV